MGACLFFVTQCQSSWETTAFALAFAFAPIGTWIDPLSTFAFAFVLSFTFAFAFRLMESLRYVY